jgi:cell wall-associated NlpC family hydrolase
VDLRIGQWERADASAAASYALRSTRRLAGPVQHGFGLRVFLDDQAGRRRAFYGAGYELTAFRARRGIALFPLASVSLGLSTDSTGDELAALWQLGGGAEWRPVGPLALGIEVAYVVEDRGPHGVWELGAQREGWQASAGVTLHWGGSGAGSPERGAGGAGAPPEHRPPEYLEGAAAGVVRTALEAIGAPYRWGGTAENGFDCSGLIQYAYGQYGVSLPRTSRDQATRGEPVAREMAALLPGDILVFSATPGGSVSHVGLYTGDGLFIHSASDGVKLSALRADDPDGRYWLPRWIGARRLMR